MMASPHTSLDATDQTFTTEVLERSKGVPVVVDFWAPWCGPCRTLAPILDKLAQEAQGRWVLVKLNTDENPETAARHQIRGIPAVKAFVGGQVVQEFTGAVPEPMLRRWLEQFVPSEGDLLVREAHELETAGRLSDARALYERAVARSPEHPAALLGLARLAAAHRSWDEVRAVLARVPIEARDRHAAALAGLELHLDVLDAPDADALRARLAQDPKDLLARAQLGVRCVLEGALDDGLDHLLTVVEQNRRFQDELGRRLMVKVFDLIGPQTDTATLWRKRLGAAMYV
jgi:putative thioredoxin